MSGKLFADFDFTILDDPNFTEAGVREAIISPIFKKLGYSPTGNYRILYNHPIKHHHSYSGREKSKPVTKYPDYLLQINGVSVLTLEAKRPNENIIIKDENLGQVFSYAFNREIISPYYGLCNGREIIIFDLLNYDPTILIPIKQLDNRWDELYRLLSPTVFINPHLLDYCPDYGLAVLKHNGITSDSIIIIPDLIVDTITKLNDDTYSIEAEMFYDNRKCCASFRFQKEMLSDFLKCVPNRIIDKVTTGLKQQPYTLSLDKKSETFELYLIANFSDKVFRGKDEDYFPLIVKEFKPFPDIREMAYKIFGNLK